MRRGFMKKVLLAGAVVMAAFCESGSAEVATRPLWSENFAQAKAAAAAKKIPVLILFSGSDWCPPCKMLEQSVFQKKAFADFASSGKVVLFHADFPRYKSQSDEVKNQNRQLMQTYNIEGVPTVVLTDASGKEFARTGYRPGGAEKYVSHLEELLKKAPK